MIEEFLYRQRAFIVELALRNIYNGNIQGPFGGRVEKWEDRKWQENEKVGGQNMVGKE